MASNDNTISTNFTGDTSNVEAALKRIEAQANATFNRMVKANQQAAADMQKAFDRVDASKAFEGIATNIEGIRGQIESLAPALAAALGTDVLFNSLNSYDKMQNALKATGLSGEHLTYIQGQLAQSADAAGVKVNDLTALYQHLVISGSAVNATQEDFLKMTQSISLATKASGTDTQATSGAMIELAHGLATGTVNMREWRSVMMSMPALNEAMAKAMGINTAALDEMVKQGKLSSQTLADNLVKVLPILQQMTSSMSSTPEQTINKLSNAIVMMAGNVDKTYGITNQFNQLIDLVSKNLDNLVIAFRIGADAMIGMGVAGQAMKIPSLIKQFSDWGLATEVYNTTTNETIKTIRGFQLGTVALGEAEAAAIVPTEGLSVAIKGLMISTGIGIAIAGLAWAIESLISAEAKQKAQEDKVNSTLKDSIQVYNEATAANNKLGKSHTDVQSQMVKTGDVATDLTNTYYKMADAATKAAAAGNFSRMQDSIERAEGYRSELYKSENYDPATHKFGHDTVTEGMTGEGMPIDVHGTRYSNSLERPETEHEKQLQAGITGENITYQNGINFDKNLHAHPLPDQVNAPDDKTGGANADAAVQFEKILAAAQIALTRNEGNRHADAMKAIQDEYTDNVKKVNANKNLTPETKAAGVGAYGEQEKAAEQTENRKTRDDSNKAEDAILTSVLATYKTQLEIGKSSQDRLATINEMRDTELTLANNKHAEAIIAINENNTTTQDQKARAVTAENDQYIVEQSDIKRKYDMQIVAEQKKQLDNMKAYANLQIDGLNEQAKTAPTQAQKTDLERQALVKKQAIDLAEAQNELDAAMAGQDEELIAAKKRELDQLTSNQGAERKSFDQDHATGAQKYYNDTQTAVGQFDPMNDALDKFGSAIEDSIGKTHDLGEAFRNMADGIVQDLLRMEIKKYIEMPLAQFLGASPSGTAATAGSTASGLGGFFSTIGNFLGFQTVPGHAMGTNFTEGGLTAVGEQGMELVNMPRGAKVYNHTDTQRLLRQTAQAGSSAPNITQNFTSHVTATGSIQKQDIEQMISRSSVQTAHAAKTATLGSINQQKRGNLRPNN